MRRSYLTGALKFVVLAATGVLADGPGELRQIGSVKQLFVDDYVIDELDGLKQVLNQPTRHGNNPIVVAEHPWEGSSVTFPSVVWDDDEELFRMYYWASSSAGTYTCYAESDDGIAWEKPILNLHNGPDGTTNNNIVLRGPGSAARTRYVARNPISDDPAKKYVAMYVDNTPGLTEYVAYSPDGIHWATEHTIGDLRNVTGYPPTENPPFFLVEQKWAQGPDRTYRAIWRTESDDMETWGGGTWAVTREWDDGLDLEFYHAVSHFLGSQTYHGLQMGYLHLFHTDPDGETTSDGRRLSGTIDTSLMVSRDTIHWTRVDRTTPFLPLGDEGSWEDGMVFLWAPEMVVDDRLYFYYGGYDGEHAATGRTAAIGLATLRLDGFVSVEPEADQGTLSTKPLEFTGDQLQINALTNPGGSIRIMLLDTDGAVLDDFGLSDPFVGDELRHVVTFGGSPDLSGLEGLPIVLRFYVDDAKLYSFTFGVNEVGDANCDGQVTDADAAILATNWQQCDVGWAQGDFNGDGCVTDADAAILATNWQRGVPQEAAAVPEPVMLVLLAGGLLPLWLWRCMRLEEDINV